MILKGLWPVGVSQLLCIFEFKPLPSQIADPKSWLLYAITMESRILKMLEKNLVFESVCL